LAAWINANSDYVYLASRKPNYIPGDAVLAYEKPAAMSDGVNMLFGDGSVRFVEMRWAVEKIIRFNLPNPWPFPAAAPTAGSIPLTAPKLFFSQDRETGDQLFV
jgi:prepilin-type processing-associated H-X9-DG protein